METRWLPLSQLVHLETETFVTRYCDMAHQSLKQGRKKGKELVAALRERKQYPNF